MFIENLNAKQQGVLLYLADKTMRADGNLAPEQLEMIKTLKTHCGADAEKIEDLAINEVSQLFHNNKEKVSLILELLGVAFSDSEYHEKEEEFIAEVSVSLGIESTLLKDCETWVKRQLMLVKEASILMEG